MNSFMNSQAIFRSKRPIAIKTRKFLVGLIYMNFLVFFQVSQAFVQPVANVTFDFSTVTEDVLFKKKTRILSMDKVNDFIYKVSSRIFFKKYMGGKHCLNGKSKT